MRVFVYTVVAFWLAFSAIAVVNTHAAARVIALVNHDR